MHSDPGNETKKSHIAAGLIIVLFSFLLSTTSISFFLLFRSTIYNGVTIENIDVGGLSVIEAQDKIKNHFNQLMTEYKIQLIYGDKVWHISSHDIGYNFDYTRAVNEAHEVGRKGNYLERLQKILSLYKQAHNIELLPVYDHSKVDSLLYNVKREIDQPPENAKIIRKNGRFEITDEKVGLKLNIERTKLLLVEKMKNLKYGEEITIQLPVELESPHITSESLSTIQDVLGVYTTRFNVNNRTRSHNIALAAKAINGTVLMPGEIFSFNDVVGPRSKERGYQNAPVIFNGELVEGLGGGVCQVSSTIYNAALISNLKIIERTKHSIPSTYVPKGQDATVSYGVLDFKFQNTTPYPIYMESYVHRGTMNIKIYGHKTDDKIVKILSREDEIVKRPIEIKYDNTLPQGEERVEQEGRDGYKVTTYKIIYQNGVEVERKQISKDYYRPQKRIILRGIKKPPAVSDEKKEEKEREKTEATPQ